jgi:hypothetical protein
MDLAVTTGYSLCYSGDVERSAKNIAARTIKDLATLLNLRLGDLITRAERLLICRDKDPRIKVLVQQRVDKAR